MVTLPLQNSEDLLLLNSITSTHVKWEHLLVSIVPGFQRWILHAFIMALRKLQYWMLYQPAYHWMAATLYGTLFVENYMGDGYFKNQLGFCRIDSGFFAVFSLNRLNCSNLTALKEPTRFFYRTVLVFCWAKSVFWVNRVGFFALLNNVRAHSRL